jgi:hypothetical protein
VTKDKTKLPKNERLLYYAILLSSLISVVAMGKYYDYHFLPLFALLSPIAAIGITITEIAQRKNYLWKIVSFLILAAMFYRLYPRNYIHDFLASSGTMQARLYSAYALIDTDPSCGFLAEADAVTYLKKANPAHKPIDVISCNRPYLRTQCSMMSATRFTELYPLVMLPPDGRYTIYQQRWRKEYVDCLAKAKPLFIVAVNNGTNPLTIVPPIDAAKEIPGFTELLNSYRIDTTIHGFTFYRRVGM